MARGVRHAMALAAGENARLFMQAIAVTVAGGTNKGRLADPRQRRGPDDRNALLLLSIIQQNFGPLCRELAGVRTAFTARRRNAKTARPRPNDPLPPTSLPPPGPLR